MVNQIYLLPVLAEHYGLHGGKLQRLGKVVVLAGPNGSGKTRYLKLVKEVCSKFATLTSLPSSIDSHQNQISALRAQLKTLSNPAEAATLQARLGIAERELQTAEQVSELGRYSGFSPTYATKPPVFITLSYPAGSEQINDARHLSPAGLKEIAKATNSVGFDNAYTGMHAYCTIIARAIYHSGHSQAPGNALIVHRRQDADAFNKILDALVGGKIGYYFEGSEILPSFRERPLDTDELSTGERLLFTWAISLHLHREALSSAIVLIDEPESHLHHEACLRALTKLRDEVLGPEGQIWLATHSVPLLAWSGLDSIHFVKDGAIEFAGNNVTSVVESLLGGKEGRERLATFLSDADEIAFMEFAVQCLLPAGIADAKTGDKQQAQFVEVISQRLAAQQSLRILDFSAGKGRFASALHERFATNEGDGMRQRIEYHAYNDPLHTEKEIRATCLERIAGLEQPNSAESYYWDSLSNLKASHGGTISLVILCNVLHEIEPENWLKVFKEIDALLAPDGVIIIMEDLLPPSGELPNKRGFLLLDEFGLGILFDAPGRLNLVEKRDGRLMAVEIPKPLASRVSKETRQAALLHIQDSAKEQVALIRKKALQTPSHRLGREHAHFSMLYTNASLVLEVLK